MHNSPSEVTPLTGDEITGDEKESELFNRRKLAQRILLNFGSAKDFKILKFSKPLQFTGGTAAWQFIFLLYVNTYYDPSQQNFPYKNPDFWKLSVYTGFGTSATIVTVMLLYKCMQYVCQRKKKLKDLKNIDTVMSAADPRYRNIITSKIQNINDEKDLQRIHPKTDYVAGAFSLFTISLADGMWLTANVVANHWSNIPGWGFILHPIPYFLQSLLFVVLQKTCYHLWQYSTKSQGNNLFNPGALFYLALTAAYIAFDYLANNLRALLNLIISAYNAKLISANSYWTIPICTLSVGLPILFGYQLANLAVLWAEKKLKSEKPGQPMADLSRIPTVIRHESPSFLRTYISAMDPSPPADEAQYQSLTA